jgi:hypothetical protein
MLTVTTVTPGIAPMTAVVKNTTSYPSHLRHALIIDFKLNTTLDPDKHFPSFLKHLRNAATQPIDMLQFLDDTPSLAIWEALQGLKHISHLEMISGYEETCSIGLLDQVGSSWPLQSIVIRSACGEDIKTAHINTITSLTLEYCCGLSFSLASRDTSSKLQKLTIIENDACDHFMKFQEETSLINNLIELKIQSTNGCDFAHQYEKEHFGKALIQCHSLKLLDLTLYDSSEDLSEEHYLTELPVFFPPNIEVLRFRGPTTLANHLLVWYQCISDPEWLPHLKSTQFSLDVHPHNEETASSQEKSTQFLKDLRSCRPSITILNDEASSNTD